MQFSTDMNDNWSRKNSWRQKSWPGENQWNKQITKLCNWIEQWRWNNVFLLQKNEFLTFSLRSVKQTDKEFKTFRNYRHFSLLELVVRSSHWKLIWNSMINSKWRSIWRQRRFYGNFIDKRKTFRNYWKKCHGQLVDSCQSSFSPRNLLNHFRARILGNRCVIVNTNESLLRGVRKATQLSSLFYSSTFKRERKKTKVEFSACVEMKNWKSICWLNYSESKKNAIKERYSNVQMLLRRPHSRHRSAQKFNSILF